MKASRKGIFISIAPGVLMFLLFYSLAIHMYQTLGGWPTSIGTRGFPPLLTHHGAITWQYCSILVAFTIFVLPVPFILCLLVRRWRPAAFYMGVHGIICAVSWGLMMLAPAPFLNWWGD